MTNPEANHHLSDDQRRFLTVADVADTLRQPPSTVAKWAARGGRDFPKASRLPNGRILVDLADLERWLKGRRS